MDVSLPDEFSDDLASSFSVPLTQSVQQGAPVSE